MIRHDTRGFGPSETEDVPFSNRADAAAVLGHVGAASAHVIGQSRGGIIGLDFLIEPPERVDPPAASRLEEVRVPVLVITGELDEMATVLSSRNLAASVEGAWLLEAPGVAHMIHLEEPERFNRLILEFLAQVDETPRSTA